MNCSLIQKELMSWVMSNTSEIVVPNYFLGRYECDVMKISSAGLIYEYEIKTSKADFKKDFTKGNKHYDIIHGKRCSRFYFVVPENLIPISDIPKEFGLIYASKGYRENTLQFKIVKMPKHLKRPKADIAFYKHVAQNLTLKLIASKRRLSQLSFSVRTSITSN